MGKRGLFGLDHVGPRWYDQQHICKSLTSFEGVVVWPDEPPFEPIVTVGSWQAWKERLLEAPGQVWDEYGRQIEVEDFIDQVEAVGPAGRGHQYQWYVEHRPDLLSDTPQPGKEWLDADGFSFYGGEFS